MLEFIDRRGTDCFRWDGGLREQEDRLGMGVADMDFKAPSAVREALHRYVEMGALGYYVPREEYFRALMDWEEQHHGYRVERDWIRVCPGVVAAFHWLAELMIQKGDAVLVQPPVYAPFFSAVRAAGGREVRSPLVWKDGAWQMDFADFERKIADNHVKLYILCSPHNPVGRVWTQEELRRALEICKAYGVLVIADEIHQDLTLHGRVNQAAAAVAGWDSGIVTLTSVSKTFNLAACQNSFAVIPDATLRERYDREMQARHSGGSTAFGYIAAEAAYRNGEPWLREVRAQVEQNYELLKKRLNQEAPGVVLSPLEGTYLAWLDLAEVLGNRTVSEFMGRDCHVIANAGEWFGGEEYRSYVRLNLATSPELVEETARRMIAAAKGKPLCQ